MTVVDIKTRPAWRQAFAKEFVDRYIEEGEIPAVAWALTQLGADTELCQKEVQAAFIQRGYQVHANL